MPTLSATDETVLAYRELGEGDPVLCIGGGPMQDSVYLGDLGGLSARCRPIVLDLRGTGESGVPEDSSSYRCDRLVDDVEALRLHRGLERVSLLGHSAGANIALQYAARYTERVGKLLLITPSTMAVGIAISGETRREIAELRRDEPWFPEAFAALESITTGKGSDWDAIAPFFRGRWDAAAQQHYADESIQGHDEAAAVFASDGAFEPEATRAALGHLDAEVLLLAGEYDLNSPPSAVTELASLFPRASLVIQPGAGHFPWMDDADRFVSTTAEFLSKESHEQLD